MILEALEVHDFRNLSGKITWGHGLNIIYGNNGQGKTNWLEAIYLLSRTKSFRTQHLRESIRFGQTTAILSGEVSNGANLQREIQLSVRDNTKSISINGKREPLARYLSQLQVFAFTADELDVVRGVPEARRRFIDRGVVSLQPAYIKTISEYNRVRKQKNKILQDATDGHISTTQIDDFLAPWNEQLVDLGARIHKSRTAYIEQLNGAIERGLFESGTIQIRYISSLEGKGALNDFESLMRQRLQLRRDAELAAGSALIGPHRDDLELLLDGREIRVYGSAGQQRSALLLLDLAAISLYNSGHGDNPLFLIDDVDAELDEKRIKQLLEYLEGRTQTFVTTSKRTHVEMFLSRASVFRIREGEVVPGEPEHDSFSEVHA